MAPPRRRKHRAVVEASPQLWEEYVLTRNEDAREQLIRHYQGFVLAAAKTLERKLSWGGLPLEELMSQAQIGLIQAVERYRPERGPFKKFASAYLFGQIIDVVRKEDWLPKKYRTAQRELNMVQRSYDSDYQPTEKELAEQLGWEVKDIRELKYHLQQGLVIPMAGMGAGVVRAPLVERTLLNGFVKAFSGLTSEQQLIISLRYYGKVPLSNMTKHFPKKFPISEQHALALETLYSAVRSEAIAYED